MVALTFLALGFNLGAVWAAFTRLCDRFHPSRTHGIGTAHHRCQPHAAIWRIHAGLFGARIRIVALSDFALSDRLRGADFWSWALSTVLFLGHACGACHAIDIVSSAAHRVFGQCWARSTLRVVRRRTPASLLIAHHAFLALLEDTSRIEEVRRIHGAAQLQFGQDIAAAFAISDLVILVACVRWSRANAVAPKASIVDESAGRSCTCTVTVGSSTVRIARNPNGGVYHCDQAINVTKVVLADQWRITTA